MAPPDQQPDYLDLDIHPRPAHHAAQLNRLDTLAIFRKSWASEPGPANARLVLVGDNGGLGCG
jgi:hypothetical protein